MIATATLLGLGFPVLPAVAAEQTVLYVDKNDPSCSDHGSGQAEQPFCAISAAAAVVQPGQTVAALSADYQEKLTITRSGTPGHPIVFTGALPGSHRWAASVGGYQQNPVTISGAHDVVFENFSVLSSVDAGNAIVVDHSARITIDHDFDGNAAAGLRVTGGSTDTVVSRNTFDGTHPGPAVQIDAGSRNTTVTTNVFDDAWDGAVSVADAPGTNVTGNTVHGGCADAITIKGAGTTATIENNVLVPAADETPCKLGNGLAVASEAVPHVEADYNSFQPLAGSTPYSWGGAAFSDSAAFFQQTGQGRHDTTADLQLNQDLITSAGSLAADSADPAAPGEPDSDYDYVPAVGKRDRGAHEYRSIGQVAVLADKHQGAYPLTVTLTAQAKELWGTDPIAYTFDFGDGTQPVTAASNQVTHVYAAAGDFEPVATASDSHGTQVSGAVAVPVKVRTPGPPQPRLTVTPQPTGSFRPLSYTFDGTASTGPWPIVSRTVDYGDGSSEACQQRCTHTYAGPGHYTATLTVKDTTGQTATGSLAVDVAYQPSLFHEAYGRILDTRTGNGSYDGTQGPLGPDSELTVNVNGPLPHGGVFTDNDGGTTAVVLNVTAVNPTAAGFLTVYPSGQTRPTTSNSNFVAGQTAAHLVTVPVGRDGTIKIYNHTGAVNVLVDLVGWYSSNGEERFTSLTPSRVLDTRVGTGTATPGQLGPQGSVCFPLPAGLGLPAHTDEVVLNLTATGADHAGFLTATVDSSLRFFSSLNFAPGETVANQVIVPISAPMGNGKVCVNNGPGHVDAVADITGYYATDGQGLFTPVTPSRLLDTRTDNSPFGPGEHRTVPIAGTPGVPADAIGAVLNLTATEPDHDGYLTAYPSGTTRSGTSTVNFAAGQTVPNLTTLGLGTNGGVDLYNLAGHTQAVADFFGYFTKG
ncbi:PKD domain-containing protein [Kitasatospora kazusensis]|uniref:PKD domain-containing protein n=1 Tax=Kitasatospora kazusensis TaxID=407974 RepID=UPI0031DADA81